MKSVFIGRFQPLHNGHLTIINKALTQSEKLIIVLGSCHAARTIKNPFTAQERIEMFKSTLNPDDFKQIEFVQVRDYHYNDKKWIMEVRNKIAYVIENEECTLVGSAKDWSTYYLDLFPKWKTDFTNGTPINATDIRNSFFGMGFVNNIPFAVGEYLAYFRTTLYYKKLKEEFNIYRIYKDAWANAPHPPIFTTVDAIIVKDGHVLVIERKDHPGKGLYALPGGFINSHETLKEAVFREAYEEVQLDLRKANLIDQKTFDYPARSLRGRTITHGFFFDISHVDYDDIKAKANDDAAKCMWLALPDLHKLEDCFFEDHYAIINYFVEKKL